VGQVSTRVEAAGPVLTMPDAPTAIHVMAKPTGAICNLDCEYCFFLSKEMLYPGSRFRMADELQEIYVRQLLEGHEQAPEVVVAWQGGEPTIMGLDFFRRSIELQRKYAKPGQRIINTLQTNGTLLNDEWGAFLKEHEFLVGISIDGPREIHDTYRVSKGGKPTFDRVIRGLGVLKNHGVDWNVLTTLHAANGDQGRLVYCFLRDELEATFIQFIPMIIERATPGTLEIADSGWGGHVQGRPLYTQTGELVTHRSIGTEQYGRFMIDVFEEWSAATSAGCTCRYSTPPWRTGSGSPPGCASTPRPADSSSRSSTTAICTAVITSSNPTICSATSPRHRCSSSSPRPSR
jgi:uncharacterized protein